MRYWPLALTGLGLPVVTAGLTASIRSILPMGVVRFWALPPGSMWLSPTSRALPPSPVARYRYPSRPKAMVPPLWLPAVLPKEKTSRREAGSTTVGLAADIFHSATTILKLFGALLGAT